MANPSYNQVLSGATKHVETTQIQVDPQIISYEKLLEIFWATHNPTTLNRQGVDVGTQYRSAIFYHNTAQKKAAENSIANAEELKMYPNKFVTEIAPFTAFYKAASYHQNYYDNNRNSNPYCSFVIDPKIQTLLEKFNSEVKEEYRN